MSVRTWPTVAIGLLMAGGCGSADDGVTGTTTTAAITTTTTTGGSSTSAGETTTSAASTTPTTPPPTNASGPKVGEVVAIVPSGGRADDELVAPGTALRQGALLAVDPAGTVDFKLDEKIQRCQARPASQVRMVAGDDVLLDFVQGTVWCGTTAGGGTVFFKVGDQLLRADDPVFAVTVDDDGAVEVRVIQGFVQVQDGPTLGEGQRGNLSASSSSWSVGPFDLGELASAVPTDEGQVVRRLLTDVLGGLPPLSYPRPDVGQSPTLQRAADAGALRVVVAGSGDDSGPEGFANEFFGGLIAEQWDVPVEVSVADQQEALAQLEQGEADVVVAAGGQGGYAPLFQDGQGRVWRAIADPADRELRQTLEGTLVTALQASCDADGAGRAPRSAPEPTCYERIYTGTIGGDPVPLSPFAALLGLA